MNGIAGFANGIELQPHDQATHHIINPATLQQQTAISYASTSQLHTAVENAQTAYETWSQTSPIKRAKILFQFRQLLIEHITPIAQLITQEHGKTLADAQGEVQRAIELVEHYCNIPHLLQGPYSSNVSNEIDCLTLRQPLGVCVGITPFNFPVMISTWMMIPAIACGNTIIIKPSEKNPSSVIYLARLLHDAGCPKGVVNVVNGNHEAAELLVSHPIIQAVSCVGSTAVAEQVYQNAIRHGKRAQAFGGAKNHALVMPDANMKDVIPALLGAGYGAAGERCMAISAIIAVTDKVADQIVSGLTKQIDTLNITNGTNANVDMGPLISQEHYQRVTNFIDCGAQEGGKLIVDGRNYSPKPEDTGYFLGASLFDHVTANMRIYQEEIFGPVLVVVRVPDYQTGLALINQHPYGNGAALFTQSGATARHFSHHVQAGMVGINVPIPVPVASHPFGGWKRSVFGDTPMHGEEGLRFYTRSKSITQRWSNQIEHSASFQIPTHE